MFTAQSEHNQGGLRQITQSPYELKRMKQYMNDGVAGHTQKLSANDMMMMIPGANIEANKTPTLSKQRMEPIRLNF